MNSQRRAGVNFAALEATSGHIRPNQEGDLHRQKSDLVQMARLAHQAELHKLQRTLQLDPGTAGLGSSFGRNIPNDIHTKKIESIKNKVSVMNFQPKKLQSFHWKIINSHREQMEDDKAQDEEMRSDHPKNKGREARN